MSGQLFPGFQLALIQLAVGSNKKTNLLRASRLIHQAAINGAQLVILPECFNSPYGNGLQRKLVVDGSTN